MTTTGTTQPFELPEDSVSVLTFSFLRVTVSSGTSYSGTYSSSSSSVVSLSSGSGNSLESTGGR